MTRSAAMSVKGEQHLHFFLPLACVAVSLWTAPLYLCCGFSNVIDKDCLAVGLWVDIRGAWAITWAQKADCLLRVERNNLCWNLDDAHDVIIFQRCLCLFKVSYWDLPKAICFKHLHTETAIPYVFRTYGDSGLKRKMFLRSFLYWSDGKTQAIIVWKFTFRNLGNSKLGNKSGRRCSWFPLSLFLFCITEYIFCIPLGDGLLSGLLSNLSQWWGRDAGGGF